MISEAMAERGGVCIYGLCMYGVSLCCFLFVLGVVWSGKLEAVLEVRNCISRSILE